MTPSCGHKASLQAKNTVTHSCLAFKEIALHPSAVKAYSSHNTFIEWFHKARLKNVRLITSRLFTLKCKIYNNIFTVDLTRQFINSSFLVKDRYWPGSKIINHGQTCLHDYKLKGSLKISVGKTMKKFHVVASSTQTIHTLGNQNRCF